VYEKVEVAAVTECHVSVQLSCECRAFVGYRSDAVIFEIVEELQHLCAQPEAGLGALEESAAEGYLRTLGDPSEACDMLVQQREQAVPARHLNEPGPVPDIPRELSQSLTVSLGESPPGTAEQQGHFRRHRYPGPGGASLQP
jgi:hypothetical protein